MSGKRRHYVIRDYGWYAEDSDGVIYLGDALAKVREALAAQPATREGESAC